MISCIAIDDEPLALELLENNISQVPFLKLVASCESAMDAMKVLAKEQVDLIFIDIQMPRLSGIKFLESMTTRPMVIMITAYEQHALEAFELDVIDYLLKPVSLERFIKACNKAKTQYDLQQIPRDGKDNVTYIFVNVDFTLLKIVLDDIFYIEGMKDYIKIYLKSTLHPVITRMNMKALEAMVPASDFVRIHKSFIIYIPAVTAVKKNSVFIRQTEIPISDSYPEALSRILESGRGYSQ